MKNTSIHFLLSMACLLGLTASGDAFAQSVQVGIAGDSSLGTLIDVTTAELSKQPELKVLERADLDKLGQEQALQSVLGSNDFSTVRLLPADGLVLLHEVKHDKKVGVFARLLVVQPGVILREVALPDGADPMAQAQALVKEFAPYWSKLTAVQKGKVTALSLLGLRFEVDAPESREIERRINILLASRLSAEPDTLVLERWRLNDAVFEKSLNSQEPAPFWTGSSLIDGSMKREDKHIEVTLRMRPPQGAEVSISDKDTADNLPDLVGRLADKVRNHPISQGAWNPSAEAGHYAELGKWCLDNRLTDQGAAAIESALALGDGSPATHRLQIRAYALLTYSAEQADSDSNYDPTTREVAPESVPDRVKWATTAVDLASRYLNANQDFSGLPGTSEDPVVVSMPVLDNCLRLLRFAYQKGFGRSHQDETTALRHAVQSLISQMEPLLAKRPSNQHDLFLTYQVRYAPYWHESPEATVDYYRELLNRKTDGVIIRTELFESFYFGLHPPCLLPEKEQQAANPDDNMVHADWISASPRIVAWDDRSLDEMSVIWKNFQKELSESSDPVLQADAIKFGFTRAHIVDRRDEEGNGARLVTFLQQHQESLCGPRGSDLLVGFRVTLHDITQAKNKDYLNNLRDLGAELLKQRVILPSEWVRWMPQIYYQVPLEKAGPLLASLDAYRQWYQTQVPQDAELVKALDEARRPLVVYAGMTPENNKDNFLIINQRWPTKPSTEIGIKAMQSMIFVPSLITAENKVWFMMFGGKQIYCIDPSNLQTAASFTVPDQFAGPPTDPSLGSACLGVTPQFLVVAVTGRALLCSRADNNWRPLEVPPSDYKPCWVNQQLYLTYDTELNLTDYRSKGRGSALVISGLIHVLLPEGKIENLISTRRIPPQTPLDGKPLGYPLDLWSSPTGLMLAADADSPHFQVFGASAGKNDWTPVTSDPLWCDVKMGTGGELVGKGFDDHGFAQLVLMNGADSQILLSNPNRAPVKGNSTARWDIPDEIRTTAPDILWQASVVMRGEDLCLYRNVMNETNDNFKTCLYYFAKGQKSGLKIPLKFQLPGSENLMLARQLPIINDYQSLQTTDYGLIIVQAMGGFCVIPWSSIDAYRAQSAAGAVQATANPVATPTVPTVVAPLEPDSTPDVPPTDLSEPVVTPTVPPTAPSKPAVVPVAPTKTTPPAPHALPPPAAPVVPADID